MSKFTRKDFPPSFRFGAATSAYQIEGHRFGGAGQTHWDSFAATPGNVVGMDDGSIACDHYHRFEEDLDLLKDGGFDAYRFSTSWARVLPEGRGTVNQVGLDYYDRLLDAILERGIEPHLTLYHWDLPSALADLGGWANRDIANWFADYSEIVMARLGDRLASVATINEPWCVSYLSHFMGAHAPGLRDIRATARAMHHVLLAHGRAMERLRSFQHQNLGIVLNFEHTEPATLTPKDADAAARWNALFNRWFIEGITKGDYPIKTLVMLDQHMPENWRDDMNTISQPIDWLGVNYYTRRLISDAPGTGWPGLESVSGPLEKTQMGWEIFPVGLYETLTWLKRNYVGDMPIIVSENGMAWDDKVTDKRVNDTVRIDFIRAHLDATLKAIAGGVNVGGFFYWSLLDNFEWAEGYAKRFGLIHVDFETQKRTPKASFEMLRNLMKRDD